MKIAISIAIIDGDKEWIIESKKDVFVMTGLIRQLGEERMAMFDGASKFFLGVAKEGFSEFFKDQLYFRSENEHVGHCYGTMDNEEDIALLFLHTDLKKWISIDDWCVEVG